MSIIYFDHNSTTKPSTQAIKEFVRLQDFALNNLSMHQLGRKADMISEESRHNIKNLLNADNFEVIFTSGASESINLAINGVECPVVLISKIEHSAGFNCRPQNKNIIEVDVDSEGLIDVQKFQEIINLQERGNFLVSIMLANNETGSIQPIKELAKITHQKNGLIHCDIVQAVGKIPVDLEDLNVDLVSISAHKIGGLQGVGALLLRKGINISPMIFGGGQEKNKRAGTLNIAGISSFAKALEAAVKNLAEYKNKTKDLRDYLEKKLVNVAGKNVQIFSQEINRLPNTCFFATKNCQSQTQLMQFDLNNICVSAGSTCSSGTLQKSRVLQAMQISKDFIDCAIRVSLGKGNNHQEVDKFVEIWQKIYQKYN